MKKKTSTALPAAADAAANIAGTARDLSQRLRQQQLAAAEAPPAAAAKIAAALAEMGEAMDSVSIEARLVAGAVLADIKARAKRGEMEKALAAAGISSQRASELIAAAEKFGTSPATTKLAVEIGWARVLACVSLDADEVAALAAAKPVRGIAPAQVRELSARQLRLNFGVADAALEQRARDSDNRYQRAQRKVRELTQQLDEARAQRGLPLLQQLQPELESAIGSMEAAAEAIADIAQRAANLPPAAAAELAGNFGGRLRGAVNKINNTVGLARADIEKRAKKEKA